MYEQNDAPMYRRLILIGVAAVVVIALIWVLVWLIFFRTTTKVAAPHRPATTQSQSAKSGQSGKNTAPKTSGSPQSNSGSEGQINAPGQSATTSPGSTSSQLANTGPGEIFLPVGAAAVAGTALYYVRLRKKLIAHA